MRVFVTGPTGFVGSAICDVLLEKGHEVLALVRRAELCSQLEANGFETIAGDMREPSTWLDPAANCDAAIHAAQQSMGFPITEAAVDATVLADGLAVNGIIEAFRKGKRLRKFLYTSGLWSYGDCGEEWVDETAPYRPVGINLRRSEREQQLFELSRKENLQVCSMVLGNVYGPGASFRGYVERARRGEHKFIGDGENFMSPIHFRDVGTAYVKALDFGVSGERYNICDDRPIHAREHAQTLCAAVGSKPGRMSFAEAEQILGKLHATSLVRSIRMRNQKAVAELDWKPQYPTFAAGVQSSIEELMGDR